MAKCSNGPFLLLPLMLTEKRREVKERKEDQFPPKKSPHSFQPPLFPLTSTLSHVYFTLVLHSCTKKRGAAGVLAPSSHSTTKTRIKLASRAVRKREQLLSRNPENHERERTRRVNQEKKREEREEIEREAAGKKTCMRNFHESQCRQFQEQRLFPASLFPCFLSLLLAA